MTIRARCFVVLAIVTIAIAMTSATAPRFARAAPVAGSQGIDTTLAATDSQVTMQGRGSFADLAVTVNQTDKLTNQAVSITWTGGQPTESGPGRFGSRYLQIMQCWGDDDGTVPDNPGPPPEQCEQGAVAGTYGGLPGGLYPSGLALSRIIYDKSWDNFDSSIGVLDPRTDHVWLPFRAVDGTVVDIQTDPTFNPSVVGGNFWLNTLFNLITTNEIAGAVTGPDGKGAELLQVLTGVQSSGLGCGQVVQPVASSGKKVPQCWIVVVPRGSPTEENAGTPFEVAADQFGVVTSPLSPAAWRNRIAIPINFNPVDSPCTLGVAERRLAGSELAFPAVASWQPSLCAGGNLPPFNYAPVGDGAARQQLVSKAAGAPGMIVVSKPLPASSVDPASPIVYSPLSVSGLVVGFNIERNPLPDAPADAQQLAGVRVAELNLTPRLVAKLLTQSYRAAVSILGTAPDYTWMSANPAHMGLDPDFLRFNPEFALLQIADSRTFSGLQLPEGNSDAAQQVWEYILADPEARAWLAGEPDEFGMKVNPVYATIAAANSTGTAFGDPLPNSFPKNDPYCYQAPPLSNSIVPPALCGTAWMPYNRGFADSAQITRVASDGARIAENAFAVATSSVWSRELPQFLGRRAMLAVTDTPSAALLGLQMARLSRAGDNTVDRAFVAPDTPGLIAGVASMAARQEPTVLEPDPAASAPAAYPLTTITYAASAPLDLDEAARVDYAAFLDYAAGPGQVPGPDLGQLPRGYAPLPDTLRANATASANLVRTLAPTPPTPAPQVPAPQVPPPQPPTPQLPTPEVPAAEPPPSPVARPRTPVASAVAPQDTAVSVPPTTPAPTSTAAPTTTTPPPTTVAPPPTTEPPVQATQVSTAPSVTPGVQLSGSRFAVPTLAVMVLGSGLGALEITKRPRRRKPGGTHDVDLGELGED